MKKLAVQISMVVVASILLLFTIFTVSDGVKSVRTARERCEQAGGKRVEATDGTMVCAKIVHYEGE